MDKENNNKTDSHSLLLEKFNNRDEVAFCEIYSIFYKDFHRYALSIYKDYKIDSNDVIQDIFCDLWERKKIVFDDIVKIKAFVIVAIKNNYRNYVRHMKYQKLYEEEVEKNKEYDFDTIEIEFYSIVHEAIGALPKDCADILMMYLEGYKPEEMAAILGKQPQTIYNKKREALSILRQNLSKSKLLMFLYLLK